MSNVAEANDTLLFIACLLVTLSQESNVLAAVLRRGKTLDFLTQNSVSSFTAFHRRKRQGEKKNCHMSDTNTFQMVQESVMGKIGASQDQNTENFRDNQGFLNN